MMDDGSDIEMGIWGFLCICRGRPCIKDVTGMARIAGCAPPASSRLRSSPIDFASHLIRIQIRT